LGLVLAGIFPCERDRVCVLRRERDRRSPRRQRHGAGVRHCGLRVHDFRGAARRSETRPHVAPRPRASLDARPFVAGVAQPAADSVSRRLPLWRHAHALADVAVDHYGGERIVWRGAATFRAAADDHRCAAGNNLRRNWKCSQVAARRGGPRRGSALRFAGVCETRHRRGIARGGFTALRPIAASAVPLRTSAAVSAGASAAVAAAPEVVLLNAEQSAPLTRFYLQEMRVFLEEPMRRGQRLGDAEKAKSAFAALQMLLPATARDTLMELEEICGEARQLRRQERLHRWLHGWLLVHIPLSLALILLGAVHAVVALRY